MTHQKWWCTFLYREGCVVCKVRQFHYGYRMDPTNYMHERNKVMWDSRFTSAERLWILDQCPPIEVNYD